MSQPSAVSGIITTTPKDAYISERAALGAMPDDVDLLSLDDGPGALKKITVADFKLQPNFSARLSANQSVDDAEYTKITFDTEEWDVGGYYDSTGAGASGEEYSYKPLLAGKYLIQFAAKIVNSDDQKVFNVAIYKNNALYKQVVKITSGTDVSTLLCSSIIDFNGTTDYVQFYVYHTHVPNINIGGGDTHSSFIAGARISP